MRPWPTPPDAPCGESIKTATEKADAAAFGTARLRHKAFSTGGALPPCPEQEEEVHQENHDAWHILVFLQANRDHRSHDCTDRRKTQCRPHQNRQADHRIGGRLSVATRPNRHENHSAYGQERYENGSGQPTLDVVRRLAIALSVSADTLVFDKDERGPDDEPRLQFEAMRGFSDEEKHIAKTLLESLILKHDASRFQRQSGR